MKDTGINEKKLIILLANDNELALKNLIDYYSQKLYVFSLGFVKKHEIAEEIVSDVFVKLWAKRNSLSELKKLSSYLFILTRNESISYLRSTKKEQIVSIEQIDEFYLDKFQAKDSESIENDTLKKINAAINTLPPRSKMAFTLAKVNGLKYKEIAEIMGISVKTVDNHIAASLKKICASFEKNKKYDSVDLNRLISFFFLMY